MIESCTNLTEQIYTKSRWNESITTKEDDFKLTIFPNPFEASTNISLAISEDIANLSLAIYGSTGQLIEILEKSTIKLKGDYTYHFTPIDLPKGIYFLVMQSEKGIIGEKLVIN